MLADERLRIAESIRQQDRLAVFGQTQGQVLAGRMQRKADEHQPAHRGERRCRLGLRGHAPAEGLAAGKARDGGQPAARFGDRGAKVIEQLVTTAESGGREGRRAAHALALVDPAGTSKRVRQWGAEPRTRRLAAIAAAATGDPSLLPELIAWMEDDTLARVSGEAFRTVTGADLSHHDLERPTPSSAEESLTDDPDDPRVELEEDEGLAWPFAESVERWWKAHQSRFPAGVRYLDGHAVAPLRGELGSRHAEALLTLIRTGRAGHAALASALLAQGAPHRLTIEPRAPATRGHVLPGWRAWAGADTPRTSPHL